MDVTGSQSEFPNPHPDQMISIFKVPAKILPQLISKAWIYFAFLGGASGSDNS